jgi:hypothetical protein|tara:strand:- start:819 stop:1043 length:225 start_codon:yes stop_codon:yes gene_type:complete
MGKFKNYIYSNAETQVDNISDDYAKGKIKLDVAVDKIKNVDNFEMIVEEHNIEDGLFYAKEDYWKKANAEGRSQ